MKQTDLPHINTPDAEWQLLGELDISVGSATDFTIDSRLTELLIPLDLSTDFKYRVTESVQDSVMRILQSNAVSTTGHIHLFIFAPYARILERKTWGFFHIERIENQTEVADTRFHAIDFYLYVEGQ